MREKMHAHFIWSWQMVVQRLILLVGLCRRSNSDRTKGTNEITHWQWTKSVHTEKVNESVDVEECIKQMNLICANPKCVTTRCAEEFTSCCCIVSTLAFFLYSVRLFHLVHENICSIQNYAFILPKSQRTMKSITFILRLVHSHSATEKQLLHFHRKSFETIFRLLLHAEISRILTKHVQFTDENKKLVPTTNFHWIALVVTDLPIHLCASMKNRNIKQILFWAFHLGVEMNCKYQLRAMVRSRKYSIVLETTMNWKWIPLHFHTLSLCSIDEFLRFAQLRLAEQRI